jgi:hypothetical protein
MSPYAYRDPDLIIPDTIPVPEELKKLHQRMLSEIVNLTAQRNTITQLARSSQAELCGFIHVDNIDQANRIKADFEQKVSESFQSLDKARDNMRVLQNGK